jgi:hypothetical protein
MKISDLQPDSRNPNKGTKRGGALVEKSLRDYGAGRSILIDSKGRIIAGNKTAANAAAAGLEDVVIVQSDGTKIIAVQRVDLDLETDPKAKALAIADNRSSDFLEWDADILRDLSGEIDLQPFFDASELQELGVTEATTTGIGDAPPQGRYKEQYGVIVICKDEADQRSVYEKLTGQDLECRVVVT